MRAFHFRLQRVLDLLETEAKNEEAALERLRNVRMQMDSERDALLASLETASSGMREQRVLRPYDLAMVDSYKDAVKRELERLAQRMRAQDAEIEKQRVRVVTARSRVKLLEKLRQKSRDTWQHEVDHEMEELIADFTAAGWLRSAREA